MNEILQKRIEEAAIKVSDVCEPCDYGDPFCGSCHRPYMYDAAKKMGEVILNNQWISVDEALPEKEGRYLCNYHYKFSNSDDEYDCIDFGLFKGWKWYVANDEVTHWMEIPSLEGGEE